MKKLLILCFSSIFFFHSKSKLIGVKTNYDSKSDVLIYNGKVYKITNDSLINPNDKEIISFNSEEKSDSFLDSFWFNFVGFSVLACFAGAMSGLTVGYLSIDMLILEIKLKSGTEQEKKYAKKIRRIISDHHWILVTLLLCNAFACEAMPILLDKLVSDIMAIVVSVTVLLFVGEIVPQALCTGPNQMKIAAFLSPFTYTLMIITYPISFPIAKFMDLVVGKHPKTRFCNSDLKSVIELHLQEYRQDINNTQMTYLTGFLDIINTKVSELMVPLKKVYKLENKFIINNNNLKEILDTGFIRIPIYENKPNNLIGVLLLKDLIGKDLSNQIALNELNIDLLDAIHVNENSYFLDLLEQFKDGKSKMAFVYREIFKKEQLFPDDESNYRSSTIWNDDEDEEENYEVKESLAINDNESDDKVDVEEALLPKSDNKEKEEIKEEDKKEEIKDENKKEEIKIKEDKIIINTKNEDNILDDRKRKIIGIITLEDLLEAILKIHFKEERESTRITII